MKYNIDEIISFSGEDMTSESKITRYVIRVYFILSFIFLLWIITKYSEHFLLWITIYVGGNILVIMVSLFFILNISNRRYFKSHVKPMNDVINQYKKDKDPYILLDNLLSIKSLIDSKKYLNIWKLNIYTALYELKEYEDAFKLLDSLQENNDDLNDTITLEKQLCKKQLIQSLIFKLKDIEASKHFSSS
ncbi:hypothetical protein [Macrococcus animalis]|uniref:hypothetical protein n=1 Tax=Macrococcus animalis TaxID=3395467 RepID=UPI0039BDD4EE